MKVESAAYKRSRAGANAGRRGNVNVGQQQQQQPQQAHHGGLVLTNAPPPELATLTPQPPQHHQQQQHAHIALPTQPYQIHHHHQQQQHMIMANNPQHKVIRRGHQIEMLQQAKHFCDRQDFVDLTIYCEDGVVRAHQMLLAVASPFLKLLFQSSPLYGIEDICLILPETKACLVQALIHFVYTGTVVSKEDHFYSLMKLVYALSINASIEAESTHERPTAFSAPLVPPQNLERVHRYPHQPLLPTVPHQQHQQLSHLTLQQHHHLQQQQQQQQHQQHQSVSAAAAAAVAAITQPAIAPPSVIPSTKMSRYMTTGPPANALPVPQHALTGQTTKQLPIQLPTQPVPMVNGVTIKNEPHHQQQQQQQQQHSYIAIDPNTGLHYKVEVPNGQLSGDLGSDPLAAIMHETIFTETSAGQTTLYTTENGQVIYTTQPAGTVAVNALMGSQSVTQAQMDPNDLSAATLNTSSGGGSGSSTKRGKKRKQNNKENAVITESVEDLPCAPDDEDLNTPYACAHCNKTIKGRVMLQAHQYQEHYDNPELARIDIGDKHPCRVCLKLFTRNSDVKAHILRVHCGDRRYPCSMCGKRFKESTHLRKHLYTHTGERPHYCTLCDKGFQTSSDLKRHKRTRVHQERVEQLKGGAGEDGTPPGGESAGDASNAEYHSWVDDDEEDEDEAAAVNRRHGKQLKTEAGSNNVASTAQQLLTSITQPVNMVASNGGQGSTIDMKALGGSANVVSAGNSAAMSVPVTTTSWAAEVVGGGEAGSSASASSAVTSSASAHHYDLKDLTAAAANEVDMATLMHDPNAGGAVDATNHSGAGASMPSIGHHDLQQQQQQQQLLQQQQQLFSMHDHLSGMAGGGDMNAASTSVGQDLSTSSMKKVDNSPGGGADEEERLTVVEDEESSSNQVA